LIKERARVRNLLGTEIKNFYADWYHNPSEDLNFCNTPDWRVTATAFATAKINSLFQDKLDEIRTWY
jgi:hypothetical protein